MTHDRHRLKHFELPFVASLHHPGCESLLRYDVEEFKLTSNKEMPEPSASRRKDEHVQIRYETSGVETRQWGLGWG